MHAKKKQSKVNTEKEIENKISEMLRDVQSSKTLSPEQLELWVAEDKAKKKRGFKYSMSIVCCCVLVLGVSIYGVGRFMNIGPFVATAGEDDKGKVVNVLDKKQIHDGDKNISAEQIVYDSWESIAKAKKKFPDLVIPTYIPEEFEFCELTVTDENNITQYLYRWISGKEEVRLRQYVAGDNAFSYGTRTLKTKNGTVFVRENDIKIALYFFDDCEVSIIGNCQDEDICRIIEGLQI